MNIESSNSPPSAVRAWFYLIQLSMRQQARVRLTMGAALGLLALMAFLVGLTTYLNGWEMRNHRAGRRQPTFQEYLDTLTAIRLAHPLDVTGNAMRDAVNASIDEALRQTAFRVFSDGLVFSIFATFLLPLWSLTFGTEALGREKEAGNLIWLLSRPLSRSSVYMAKFVALLPWSLALNLGGFALLCVLGGEPGWLALRLYWPAVLIGTLAFSALFHFLGMWSLRPAVVAILYSFFLETFMGNMPGYMKRASISFYVRCIMLDAGAPYGVGPENPEFYHPVSGWTGWLVLAGLTVALLIVGMIVFARREYLQ